MHTIKKHPVLYDWKTISLSALPVWEGEVWSTQIIQSTQGEFIDIDLENYELLRNIQGASNKWGDLFYDQYLHQIKQKSAGYIFHLNG